MGFRQPAGAFRGGQTGIMPAAMHDPGRAANADYF